MIEQNYIHRQDQFRVSSQVSRGRILSSKSWLIRLRNWLTADRVEPILTVITLVTMISGLLAEQFNAAPGVATTLFATAYFAGGLFGLKAGLESLRHLTIDVDLLMVVAALGAWMVGSPFEGALLLFLFSLSNVLQSYALGRTRYAIRALMKLRPNEALTRRGSRKVLLPIDQLVLNDVVIVRPGERIPVDGEVIEGESTVDQAAITGESMPVGKRVGSPVLAGTINQAGGLEIRVTKPAEDSTISKMINLVEEAQSEKAQTQRFIDKFEQYYAIFVIALTALMTVVPVFGFGETFDTAFYRAMTAMVAASPCALVISTPASILSAISNGARKGILFKGGIHLEQAADIKVVAFDKTGTLTEGKPHVTDIIPIPAPDIGWEGNEDDLLRLAAGVEAKSEHPLSHAILDAARQRHLSPPEVTAFRAEAGKGVSGVVDGQRIYIGSLRYFEGFDGRGMTRARREIERLQAGGKTPVLVARVIGEGTAYALGVIGIADVLRPDVSEVVNELRGAGVERVVMLTGDSERVARAIAGQAGVDEFYADLLPEDKVRIVRELKAQSGTVAMVGDGVNDAPALATATLGIALGAGGTDVALETADVVLLADDLRNIPYLIGLSRQTKKTLMTNLGFASAMIVIMLVAILAVQLILPLAVIGHEGGTVLVSLNGLRLLLYNR